MAYRDRSRSPPRRAYSPSQPIERDRSPPPPPRRYDDRRECDYPGPPPRDRDRGSRPSPPRDRDRRDYERYDRGPPPRRYDDRRGDYDRGARERDRYDDRERDRRDDRAWRDDRDRRDRAERGDYRHDYDDGARRVPSEPSRDLIFLGLDPELGDKELEGFLRVEHGVNVDSAKIVRDRQTGQSKCFGFAQFPTIALAKRFMDDNSPVVTMPALYSHSEPRRVKIDFAGARGDQGGGPPRAVVPPLPGIAQHDGTRDIGQPAPGLRVLLLRGLDPGTYAGEIVRRVGEEILRMLGKGDQRKAEACISRIAMIVDRASSVSWGFAFVELVTPELASALMPFLFSPQHQPNGFLISGMPIAASFANSNAFIPTPSDGGQYLLRAATDGGIGSATIAHPDGEYCAYWHQLAGAVETVPRGAPPVPARGSAVELTDETRAFLGNLAGKQKAKAAAPTSTPAATGAASDASAPAQADAPPGGLQGGMQPIKIGFGAAKKKPKEEPAMVQIMAKSLVDDNDEVDLVGKDSVLLSRTKGAHMIPPTSTSRKVMGNISKWNTKQTELKAPKAPKAPNAPPAGVSDANAAPIAPVPAASSSAMMPPVPVPAPAADDFDFGDTHNFEATGKVACLLCQRQFKSEDMLRKHNAQSELHKTNLADAAIREAGKRRKNNAVAAQTGTGLQYRDRAAERREVHHQPDQPLPEGDPRRKDGAGAVPEARSRPKAGQPESVAPGTDQSNVGNKLLSKMGWTSGSGLGINADGRADPVRVQQFEERAGLGAAQGRDAGRWSGPGGWQRRAQDMTQERYKAMEREQDRAN